MRKKPILLIISLVYLLSLTLFHWGIKPSLEILFFLAGGALGVYFLDLADLIFKMSAFDNTQAKPSPFRNVLFQSPLAVLSLFVLTSSGSLFGTGLVLTLFLGILIDQREELGQSNSLQSWFSVIKTEILASTQKLYFWVMVGIFIFLSFLFI